MYSETQDPDWFTSDHENHDFKWLCTTNHNQVSMCIACIIEFLEDPEELCVKKKLILGQLVEILEFQKNHLVQVLADDSRVAAHVSLLLLGLSQENDKTFASMAIEVLYEIVMALQNEEVLGCTIDNISSMALKLCNYKKCLGMFNLLGKLLHNVPPLKDYILQNNASLVDFICSGIGYPDHQVQCCLSYICIELYRLCDVGDIPIDISAQVSDHILQSLSTTTQTQDLTVNLLGLLKTMLENPDLADMYMQKGLNCILLRQQQHQSTFAGAMKRVLLSRIDVVQMAGVQCVITLLNTPAGKGLPGYARVLLKHDIAEFLFEALNTVNDLLIGSIFNCFLLFTKCDTFFHKCHAVYGIEALVRSLELMKTVKNIEIQTQGMKLLSVVLANHTGSIRLFGSAVLLRQCLDVIAESILHHTTPLSGAAADCLFSILRKGHLTSPPPYSSIMAAIQNLVTKFCEQPVMTCMPPGIDRISNKLDTRSEAKTPKEMREKHLANQQQKSLKTQMWLRKLISIVNQALGLCEELRGDPVQDEQSYTCPESASQLQVRDNIEESNMVTDNSQMIREKCNQEGATSVLDFACLLQNIIDNTCVPALLDNMQYVSDSKILCSLYSALTLIIELSKEQRFRAALKLVSEGFIAHAIQANSSFSDGEMKAKVSQFLQKILEILILDERGTSHDLDQLQQILRKGCENLYGDMHSILCILDQSTHADDRETSCCAIYVIYYTAQHCPMLLTDIDCYEVINHVVDATVLNLLPKPVFKYLLFLHAWSVWKKDKDFVYDKRGESQLLEYIQTCKGHSDWCTPKHALLHWCFSDENIAEICGKQMLECWTSENDADLMNHLHTFMTVNVNVVKVLMVQITTTDDRVESYKAFSLIYRLLKEDTWHEVEIDIKVKTLLRLYLPEFTHRCFLQQHNQNTDVCLPLLLQLLCHLKLRTMEEEQLTTLETKLILQVCKRLSGDNSVEEHASYYDVCWQFINICLLQAEINDDDRVITMVLSYPTLVTELGSAVYEGQGHHTALFTLALVMNQLQRFNLTNDGPSEGIKLLLPLDKFVMPLLIAENQTNLCNILLFWMSYFTAYTGSICTIESQLSVSKEEKEPSEKVGLCETGARSVEKKRSGKDDIENNLQKGNMKSLQNSKASIMDNPERLVVIWKDNRKGLHFGRGDGVGQLSDEDILTLYIYLLQCVLKECPLMSDMAVVCLDKLLHYTMINDNIYNQLRNERWTPLVIKSLVSGQGVQDISHTSSTFLNFINVLIKHKIDCVKPYMENITCCLVKPVLEELNDFTRLSYKHCLIQVTTTTYLICEEVKKKKVPTATLR